MRLFVALTPPLAVRRGIASEARRWLGATADVRRVTPERMHLTVAFLGEIANAELVPLRRALRTSVAGCSDFELATTDWGRFPARGRPRVYWLGIAGGAALEGLARSVRTATSPWQPRLEEESFRPHVTVARVGTAYIGRLPGLPDQPPAEASWPAGRLELIRSRLGSGPAVHEVLDRFVLTLESTVAP